MTAMENLGGLWNSIQSWLFPMLEDELGELDEKHREFVAVCELCDPQSHMDAYRWLGNGCPPNSRLAMCKAFIAKAVWDFDNQRIHRNQSPTGRQPSLSEADKKVLKCSRYILLKKKENLTNNECNRLQNVLNLNENLNSMYILNDQLKLV